MEEGCKNIRGKKKGFRKLSFQYRRLALPFIYFLCGYIEDTWEGIKPWKKYVAGSIGMV